MSKRFPFGLPFGPGKSAVSMGAVPMKSSSPTAFEVAQISVSLAVMKGEKQADIDGAIELLQQAALRLSEEGKPAAPIWAHTEKQAEELRFANPGVEVHSPKTHPDDYLLMLHEAKNWPGSDTIKPPKRFPASAAACWRALLGGRSPSIKKREIAVKKVTKANPDLARIAESSCPNEFFFWRWAFLIAQSHPRFAEAFGKKAKRTWKRRKQKNAYT